MYVYSIRPYVQHTIVYNLRPHCALMQFDGAIVVVTWSECGGVRGHGDRRDISIGSGITSRDHSVFISVCQIRCIIYYRPPSPARLSLGWTRRCLCSASNLLLPRLLIPSLRRREVTWLPPRRHLLPTTTTTTTTGGMWIVTSGLLSGDGFDRTERRRPSRTRGGSAFGAEGIRWKRDPERRSRSSESDRSKQRTFQGHRSTGLNPLIIIPRHRSFQNIRRIYYFLTYSFTRLSHRFL